MTARASPEPAGGAAGAPVDAIRPPWGLVAAVADLVAPASALSAARWTRNLSLAGAVVAWILPRSTVLGSGSVADMARACAAFAVAAVFAHVVRKRPRGSFAAAGVVVVAALVARTGPSPWPFLVAGLCVAVVALSAARRRAGIAQWIDPPHRGISGLAWWIAWVLVAKEFAVLPIHVPTGSMQPAIQGASTSSGGDRLLVDRAAYVRGDPKRWDVAVFEYPLHRATTFVKRVVGLPGETVEIRDGDLWIDGRIARRPSVVLDSMWREDYPKPVAATERRPPGERWSPPRGTSADALSGVAWVLEGDTFRGGGSKSGGESVLRYTRAIETGDVRVKFAVTRSSDAAVTVRIRSRDTPVELVAPASDAPWELRVGGEVTARFAPGVVPDELYVADGLAVTRAAGRELARAEVTPGVLRRHGVEFAVSGGTVSISGVSVALDQVWTPAKDGTREWKVPAGAYFVLGDNAAQSEDSREWRVSTVELEGGGPPVRFVDEYPDDAGGKVPNVRREDDEVRLTDVDGVPRRFPRRRFGRRVSVEPAPFVPRGHFIGRAAFIFWSFGPDGQWPSPRLLP